MKDLCAGQLAERPLRERVLDALRPVIDFSFYAWLLTDPETLVGTAPLAHVPELGALPRIIRSKYLATTGRWTSLPANRCVALSAMNDPPSGAGDTVWRDLLNGYGVTDLVSLSLRDRYGSWSFLDLWRCGGSRPTFIAAEITLLDSVATSLTRGVRLAIARSFAEPAGSHDDPEPGVLILDDDLRPQEQTANADPQLRDLLTTAPGLSPVPTRPGEGPVGRPHHPVIRRKPLSGGKQPELLRWPVGLPAPHDSEDGSGVPRCGLTHRTTDGIVAVFRPIRRPSGKHLGTRTVGWCDCIGACAPGAHHCLVHRPDRGVPHLTGPTEEARHDQHFKYGNPCRVRRG
ncbi:MAG: hypothetical protein ACR2P2_15250 [Nakamurella sp.]